MCAISGVIGMPWSEEILQAMLETMHRRGPDGRGIYTSGETALLHNRLAIVDLKGGKQPMQLHWAGETYVLVYNGELYNTEDVRKMLEKKGHCFEGHSDTEVVLHAYAEYGGDCVEYLNGIYAFAVWEEQRQRLFLCRDRIGVKPLFFYQKGNGLLFASEIKTILTVPGIRACLDEEGLAQLLLLGPGRLPGSGVFRGIRELEPGCWGYWEKGRLQIRRYWKLRDREHRESFEETVQFVRSLVEDAVRRQMVADVPVGTFLSGGLDSSIITAICAKDQKLKTFSVDYENNDRYFRSNAFQPDSDSGYIRLMQETFQTDHHWTVLRTTELLGALEDATIARDLPGMADVDFSLLVFSGDIRREVKVALSGECADEIFGGYPWYRDSRVRAKEGFPWAQNTAQRCALLKPKLSFDPREFLMDSYRQTCRESDILPGATETERRIKEMVNLNFRWFMQTLLDRKDRMSMYHGLEVRVPFCDHRIAEYLYGVPWEMKEYQGREKGLLRKAVEGLLPGEVLYRKKSPYPKTFDPAYETLVMERLNVLLEEDTPLWHLVEREEVRKMLAGEAEWPWYGQLMRRPQTTAYLLQLDFWLKRYQIELYF